MSSSTGITHHGSADVTARKDHRAAKLADRAGDRRLQALLAAMLLVCLIRGFIFGVGLASIYSAPPDAEPRFNYEHPWVAWDAHNYYEVALHGYAPDRFGKPFREITTFSLIAYFPLVPLLSRALSSAMPLDIAMVAMSNVCSLVGFAFLFDWARRLTGSVRIAFICLLLVATFPGAVSFAAGMTEGPFFMFVSIFLWLLELDQLWWAAIVSGIATALRPTGVAMAIVLPLYALVRQTHLSRNRRLVNACALGLLSLSGILCYQAFLWHRYGTPTAYFDAQSKWNQLDQQRVKRDSASGVDRYSWQFFKSRLTSPQAWNRGLALLIFILMIVGFLRPTDIPRALFLLPLVIFLMTCLPGHGLRISSLPRYESGVGPLFLLPAIWLTSRKRLPLLTAILLLQFFVQIYYAFLFPREIWVG